MGIKDLNPFLRTRAPKAFRLVKISDFRRKRIAIDATLIIYQSFAAAFTGIVKTDIRDADLMNDNLFSRERDPATGEYLCPNYRKAIFYVFNRVNGLVWEMYYNGITPIFVHDGEAIHEKNSYARERRKQVRDSTAARVSALKQQILDTPILERAGNSDFASLRKLLAQVQFVKPYEDFDQIFKHVQEGLGAPVIKAPNEAEKFCAFLAGKGVAAASFSTDTDSYVFGAPIVISDIDQETKNANYAKMVAAAGEENERTGDSIYVSRKQSATHFTAVITPVIMRELGLTQRQFVDFCIMLGCDFNSRVPGVGPARSWKMVSDAIDGRPGSERIIEKIAETNPKFDWSTLCQERCREIFTQMTDCEVALESMIAKSPNRAIFNVSGNTIKNTDVKNCYIRYFLPKLDPLTQSPEEVEYHN